MKTAQRIIFALILVVVPGVARPDGRSLKVGVSAALSGPFAHFGKAAQNGFLMARLEHPRLFKQLELVFEDDGYNPKRAISVFHKFRMRDQVDIIYIAGVAPSEAVIPLAERYAIPLLVNCQRPFAALSKQYVVRTINYTGEYVDSLLNHLRLRGFSKLGIVATDAPYIEGYVEALNERLNSNETLAPIIRVSEAERDLRTLITRIKGEKLDALGVFLFPGQASSFFRQAKSLGLEIPFFSTDVLESKQEILEAGAAMDGAVYAFNEVDSSFAVRYRSLYGNDEQIGTAANSYAVAKLIGELLSEQTIFRANQFMPRLMNMAPTDSVLGTLRPIKSAQGAAYFHFPVVIRQIRGNKILTLSRE